MYPGTIFNIIDQSAIQTPNEIPAIDNRARFFVVSSFDKGPEDLREVEGEMFTQLYGVPTFAKHGQNGIQAKRIIDAGGVLVVKRVCAEDAKLANLILCAKVNTTQEQKKDAEGHPIYLDEDGNETIVPTDHPVMITVTSIKWEANSVANCKTFDEVKTAAMAMLDESAGVYPLFMYSDIGRGTSVKAVRLIPDYNTSKGIGQMYYNSKVYEGTTVIENQMVTFDPDIVYDGTAYGIDRSSYLQLDSLVSSEIYEKYVAKIAQNLGSTPEVVRNYDLVYCYDCKGAPIANLSVDAEGVDLNSIYGIELKQGNNGSFGDEPAGSDEWTEAIRAVFAGEGIDEVWDVDSHPLTAVVDAAFPLVIKQAIATFVSWRKDCVYFRDFGVGLTTYAEIRAMYDQLTTKNYFIADFSTSYTIKDPTTKKNIEVTMLYDFVEPLINHYNTNISAPTAGIYNGFILKNAIKNTINFTPIITPAVNQKAAFEDLKINYAIFNNDQCVVQSCYTSQEANTELSYINNIMAVQEVIRAIRIDCPRNRYQLGSGTDLSRYAEAVNNLLEGYKGRFYSLNFVYTEDKLKAAQKIFYASIEVSFNQWAQAEVFDVYVLNSANIQNA